jgi:preprotein translocase subunit YajC
LFLLGVGEAFAMGAQPASDGQQPSLLIQMVPFILMFGVIYFLILRPQHKKQKQQKEMVDALKKGDKVVTSGGIHGTIVGVKEKEGILVLQVAKEVRIEVSRGSVSRVAEEKGK